MLPTLRGEQSGYYQYQLKMNKTQSPQKGLFCPFIILHIIKYVKKIGGKINEDRVQLSMIGDTSSQKIMLSN